jgi:hypothetical protein
LQSCWVVALDQYAAFDSAHLPSFRAKKSFSTLQLANLPIQDIDLCLAGPALGRATAVKNTGPAVRQLRLPIVDLVRMNPTSPVNSAIVRLPLIAAKATFALNAPLCFCRVRFMSCSRAIRAF